MTNDPINPKHYRNHPSGVECITITEHFNFNKGNAIKYIWRSQEKGDELEQLRKARWYIDREITRIEKESNLCLKGQTSSGNTKPLRKRKSKGALAYEQLRVKLLGSPRVTQERASKQVRPQRKGN